MLKRGLVHYYAPNVFSRGDAVDYCTYGKRCKKHVSIPGRGARYTRDPNEVTCSRCLVRMAVDTERVMCWPNCIVCHGIGWYASGHEKRACSVCAGTGRGVGAP